MKDRIRDYRGRFHSLHLRLVEFVESIPDDELFITPVQSLSCSERISCGVLALRSAGAVEQTFGGITSKLWDDPFEWTLPEELSTTEKILDYFREVERTRHHGFSFFGSDAELERQIPAPEKLKSLAELLDESIVRAEGFYERARVARQSVIGAKVSEGRL